MRALMAVVACTLAALPAVAGDDPAAGSLHGTVITDSGREVTGFLRNDAWDTWWDDILTATRTDSPWTAYIDEDALAKERRAAYFQDHGLVDRLAYVLGGDDRKVDTARQFLCRYGQVARIVFDGDEATIETTDGGSHQVRRRRDLRGELTIANQDSVVLDLDDVREIIFGPAPAGTVPPWRRLGGTVTTSDGTLTGFISWDRSECTDLDELNGEADGQDHDLAMGTIVSIAKDRDGSLVTLRDGRTLHLTGTNDVNGDNRGIGVEVAGLGRVTVPWKRFVRVDFDPPAGSGPGRADFTPGRELAGTTEDRDGRRHEGRLVYDLDEGWTWDIFNGTGGDSEYDLPFAGIAAIDPTDTGSRVTLRSGTVLELDDGTDATGDNAGILVLGPGEPVRIPWSSLVRLILAP